jgi:hypothetical protein
MKDYVVLIGAIIGAIGGLITIALKVTEIIESPMLIYVIVAGYLLFGGGIVWFAFTKTDTGVGLRLSSLLILWLVTMPLFYWIGNWTNSTEQAWDPCQEYGITVIEPPNGYIFTDGQVTIRGSFTKKTPDNTLALITVSQGQYWPFAPQDRLEITATSWRGRVFGGTDYTVIVAYVGPNGQILFDYFQKAGKVNNNWPGIDVLPDDVAECASVFVSAR